MAGKGRRSADEPLLVALACGATVQAAAQKAGVSPATVYRRLQEAGFKQRLQELRADMVQRTAGMLTAAAGEAVKTLLALQKDTTPAAVRLGAARAILEIGMKVRDATELEERLAALEQRLAQQQAG
jgi:DNA-binding MurR/RpiR family transcriptional regulator